MRTYSNPVAAFYGPAWSEKLAGSWTFEAESMIPPGAADEFDAKRTDAVTGYYFPRRKEFLYFYMGYPAKAQPRDISPFGSTQAIATQELCEKVATKRGVILEPCQGAGHWASGRSRAVVSEVERKSLESIVASLITSLYSLPEDPKVVKVGDHAKLRGQTDPQRISNRELKSPAPEPLGSVQTAEGSEPSFLSLDTQVVSPQ